MHNYCTNFDMGYFPKWLVMYKSWLRWSYEEDVMHVLPMNAETHDFLNKTGPWPRVRIWSWAPPRPENRTWAEHCWSMAPYFTQKVKDDLLSGPHPVQVFDVTYLDADLRFYAPISHIWGEMSRESVVAIVPHRFMPEDVARLSPNGLYNVSWVTFRNDPCARAVLDRWAEQVRNKCDKESCGDQKYLDEWPALLGKGLHVFKEPGIGMGPWHVRRYTMSDGLKFFEQERELGEKSQLYFYHFHELTRRPNGEYYMTGYKVPISFVQDVYVPYIAELDAAYAMMEQMKRMP